jgi:hypothetical protein
MPLFAGFSTGLVVQVVFPFKFKISSEIEAANVFVVCEFFSGSVFKDLAFNQQIGPVANG